MKFKLFSAVFIFAFFINAALAAEEVPVSDQQISDFSLAGYGEKGKKTWDLSGKTADIFENVIKLTDLTGNMYGKEEGMQLTADSGDFDKSNGKIHVEKNVVITTSSGAKLTTDSLDWDRVNSVVSTKDYVRIKRDTMVAVGTGAYGQPNLNKMNLEKEVTVVIIPQGKDKTKPPDEKEKIEIYCDGPLQIDYEKNIATFNNNVRVKRQDMRIFSDSMEIYFGGEGNKEKAKVAEATAGLMGTSIDKIIARGNVKTLQAGNITYSDEATYTGKEKTLVLTGRPHLLIYSSEAFQGFGAKE